MAASMAESRAQWFLNSAPGGTKGASASTSDLLGRAGPGPQRIEMPRVVFTRPPTSWKHRY